MFIFADFKDFRLQLLLYRLLHAIVLLVLFDILNIHMYITPYKHPTTFLICRLHCSHIHTPSINSNLLIFAYSSHSLCYYSTNVWPTKRPFATFWTLNSHSAHWKLSCQLALLDDISHSSPVAQCCSYYCCSSNELNPHELTQFGHDLSDAHARNSSTTCKGPPPTFPLQSLPTPLQFAW